MDPASPQPLSSVLSAPYSDLEIKDSLAILDRLFVENTPESRRQLRIDVQRDVIESDGAIIRDFTRISEVRVAGRCPRALSYLRVMLKTAS